MRPETRAEVQVDDEWCDQQPPGELPDRASEDDAAGDQMAGPQAEHGRRHRRQRRGWSTSATVEYLVEYLPPRPPIGRSPMTAP